MNSGFLGRNLVDEVKYIFWANFFFFFLLFNLGLHANLNIALRVLCLWVAHNCDCWMESIILVKCGDILLLLTDDLFGSFLALLLSLFFYQVPKS